MKPVGSEELLPDVRPHSSLGEPERLFAGAYDNRVWTSGTHGSATTTC